MKLKDLTGGGLTDLKPNKDLLIPWSPCRVLVAGSGGSGKTNLLLNLLYRGLRFTRLFLILRNPDQRGYQKLIDDCRSIDPDSVFVGSTVEDIPDVDSMDKKETNLIVFDDMILDKPEKMLKYFVRGRHMNCSVIFLSQNYFKTDKTIRLNCTNYLLSRPQNGREKTMVYQDLGFGMDKDEFIKRWERATQQRFNFFHVDLQGIHPALQFRRNFDSIWVDADDDFVEVALGLPDPPSDESDDEDDVVEVDDLIQL